MANENKPDVRGMVCIGEIHNDIIKNDPLYKRGFEDARGMVEPLRRFY